MLPVSQSQAYEVIVPKQLKKPLVVNRQRLRVSHQQLAKAASQQKLGMHPFGFPMQISSKPIDNKPND